MWCIIEKIRYKNCNKVLLTHETYYSFETKGDTSINQTTSIPTTIFRIQNLLKFYSQQIQYRLCTWGRVVSIIIRKQAEENNVIIWISQQRPAYFREWLHTLHIKCFVLTVNYYRCQKKSEMCKPASLIRVFTPPPHTHIHTNICMYVCMCIYIYIYIYIYRCPLLFQKNNK